jgi:hypothetical protein
MGEDGITERFQVSFAYDILFHFSIRAHVKAAHPVDQFPASLRRKHGGDPTRGQRGIELIGPWHLGDKDICKTLG